MAGHFHLSLLFMFENYKEKEFNFDSSLTASSVKNVKQPCSKELGEVTISEDTNCPLIKTYFIKAFVTQNKIKLRKKDLGV